MSRSVRPTLLIVCTANVCRSPYSEFLIADAFRDVPAMGDVRVGSSGIRPVPHGRTCELVAARRPHSEHWDEFLRRHVSIPSTPSRVAQAGLILTASRSNRAALALIDPAARSRTFTLREAAWLGSDYVRDPSVDGTEAITAFARYLDSRRGKKPPPSPARVRWFSPRSDALSIADGHNLGQKEHVRTLHHVEEMSVVVAGLIVAGAS